MHADPAAEARVAAIAAADAAKEFGDVVAHPFERLSHGARRIVCLPAFGTVRRTSRWANTAFSAAAIKYGSTPMFTSRVTAEQASLVCSVLKTR